MANNKKTIKEMLTQILNNHRDVLTDEEVKFLEGRIKQAEKKSSGGKKATATQIANEGIKAEILNSMEVDVKYTVTDMIKQFDCCADLTNQKVSALVTQLKDAGKINKTMEGRKSYFSLA
jgi:outer membrane receptor for ferrienterochelin and colicin